MRVANRASAACLRSWLVAHHVLAPREELLARYGRWAQRALHLHRSAPGNTDAAEAAALQGAFWPFHDALFADQAHIDDPHLWDRCERLGLDGVAERVARDVREATRAGVTTAPALVRPSVD
jgi:hypothetical protein